MTQKQSSGSSSSSSSLELAATAPRDRAIMAASPATANTIIVLLLFAAAGVAGATEYTVGDSDGWSIGPSYVAWSQKYNFTTGDRLVFNYVRRQHDVLQVTQDAFRSCEPVANKTVLRSWKSGRDVVDLPAAGDYYFICNITGHCLGGMKFSVAVGVPSPPPSPPPPPPSLTRPPPPPPSSGASSKQLSWTDEARTRRLAVAIAGMWIGSLLLL